MRWIVVQIGCKIKVVAAALQLQRTPGPGDEMLEEVWNTSQTYDEFMARLQQIHAQKQADKDMQKQQQAEKHQGDNDKGDEGSGSQTNRPVIKKHGKDEKKQEKLRKRD